MPARPRDERIPPELLRQQFLQSTPAGQAKTWRWLSAWMVAAISAPAGAQTFVETWTQRPTSLVLAMVLSLIVGVMLTYGLRQILYALHRMTRVQRYPYAFVKPGQWPAVTVFIAAHNEEKVIAGSIRALLASDYPAKQLKVVVVNDRSSDRTSAIVNDFVSLHPERLQAFHRTQGKPGKAAALKDAMQHARGDIALIFDADYTPGPGLLKQLVAPFWTLRWVR